MNPLKLLYLIICLASASVINAQVDSAAVEVSPTTDTTKTTDKDNNLKLNVGIKPFTPSKANKKLVKTRWFMLDAGISSYMHDGGFALPTGLSAMEQRLGQSLNWQFHLYKQRIRLWSPYTSLYHGLTWNAQHYNFQNGTIIRPREAQVRFDTLSDLKNNRLFVGSARIPLYLNFESAPNKPKQSVHMSVGLYGEMMLVSNYKRREANGDVYQIRDDFNMNKFKWGMMAQLGFGPVTFFVDYSFTPMFRQNQGPALNPINIGVTLLAF